MKFTYEWLKEYVDCPLNPAELAEALTAHGLKVENFRPAGADAVYELEVTANRPDCLSLLGIAREVALLTGTHVKLPAVKEPKEKKHEDKKKFVQITDPDLCPLYIGRIIRGIRVATSPEWMRRRLEAIGLRPVNNIVDITNYVLYETDQPLHTFDLARLAEGRVVVRRARAGEKIKAIDDKNYTLTPEMLVIADARSPMAIAGVMGGKVSEISSGTTDLLLESAVFNPAGIRQTSRRLKLASDSSYRFERGVNATAVDWAAQRAVTLIRELAGGDFIARQEVSSLADVREKRLVFRFNRSEDILGISIDKTDIKRILKGLGFVIKKEYKGIMEVLIPPFRPDINREIDVIEEIIRIVGYEQIPFATPDFQPTLSVHHKTDDVGARVKPLLRGAGYNEVLTASFLEEKYLDDFPLWSTAKALGLLNPEGIEDRFLRKSLLPCLLVIQRTNQGYSEAGDNLRLFEIAKSYAGVNGQPAENFRLSLLDTNGFASLKGMLVKILSDLHLTDKVQFVTGQQPCFVPGHCLQIKQGENTLGWLGELADKLTEKYELRKKPALAELDFEALSTAAVLNREVTEFSRFPAIRRDLALLFDRTAPWSEIETTIRQDAPDWLEEIRFFDLYAGKNIPSGKKSLAFSVVFRANDRTLTHEEVDKAVQGVVNRLNTAFKATLRQM